MIIRAKTFKDWFKANLAEEARDIANYGAAGGFHGIIYYEDTVKLYDKFEEDIWEALVEDAGSFGHKSPAELIATFNGAKDAVTPAGFKNLLVWYMAERIAHEMAGDR